MATLFEKVKIGNLELKNRVVMCPMGFAHTDLDGGYSDRQINYYVERAKGGFGLIYPTCTSVTTKYEAAPMPNVLETYSQGTRLAILAERVHMYGAKLCVQLSLGLGRVHFHDRFTAPHSSSATPSFWFEDLICVPFTVEEIKELVQKFGYAALLAKNAGADAIEIHAYGGYLIDQFLTPLWNLREDEYGGSLENRLRILYELRDVVWQNCGKDFPLLVKLTIDHQIEGGRTLDEGIELLHALDDAGFTAFHLDEGCYECWYNAVTTVYQPEGNQLYMAEAAKAAGIKTPLFVQGKLNNPVLAEKVVRDGTAELVGLGHQALADAHWANKARLGKFDDITPCIGCNECINSNLLNRNMACAVNPLMGMEVDYKLTPAPEKKSVLVVGGGPGGMTAAITAARRGLAVELWEKDDVLGGALNASAAPEFKASVGKYVNHLKAQLYQSGADVRLNTLATVESVLKRKPDVVIIASGADPIIPKLPGMEKMPVFEATELLKKGKVPYQTIVVLGGGLVGCEAALELDAAGKDVTIVEALDNVLLTAQHATNNDMAIKHMLNESKIKTITSARLVAVEEDGVIVRKGEEETKVPCQALVIAIGYTSDHGLFDALSSKMEKVYMIGDNVKPAKVIDAVHQGYHTVRLLEELE